MTTEGLVLLELAHESCIHRTFLTSTAHENVAIRSSLLFLLLANLYHPTGRMLWIRGCGFDVADSALWTTPHGIALSATCKSVATLSSTLIDRHPSLPDGSASPEARCRSRLTGQWPTGHTRFFGSASQGLEHEGVPFPHL